MPPAIRRALRTSGLLGLAAVLAAATLVAVVDPTARATATTGTGPVVTPAADYGRSGPLRDLPATTTPATAHPAGTFSGSTRRRPYAVTEPAAVQTTGGSGNAFSAPTANFDGVGHSISGYSGGGTPPDENSDVSSTQIVEVVNTSVAVFGKTGTRLAGPVDTSQLFAALTGPCKSRNDGDGVVRYDSMAHRWFVAQFAIPTVDGLPGPNYECVAVSSTDDATGSYHVYAFADSFGGFPDYGKFGVWPDGYYATFNEFTADGTAFLGAVSCAYNRTAMLAGSAATQQCFNLGSGAAGLLPAEVDGPNAPPLGTPDYLLSLGSDYSGSTLSYWQFHVDWTTPANSVITAQPDIPVDPYTAACASAADNNCVPEPSPGHTLDSLGDRLMFPLLYRSYGADAVLTVSHSVTTGSTVGERWYALHVDPANRITVDQQGTYSPADGLYRFMGSIAGDHAGDLALGYSTSSISSYPAIRYTGRLAGDPAGTMTQAEQTIRAGSGFEPTYGRWGDYSSMNIDPTDDCTFWYTNEYYTPGADYYQWNTRIAAFRQPGCSAGDFGLSLSQTSGGGHATTTVQTSVVSGTPGTVGLSVAGVPAGATATLSSTSVSAGGSSVLTLDSGSATPGTYPLVITGQSPSGRHSVEYDLVVRADDFRVDITPSSGTAGAPGVLTATVSTALLSGSSGSIALSVAGAPTGATAQLDQTSVTTGGSATLTVDPGSATAGSYPITVTATDTRLGGATHTAVYQLSIAHGFAIGLSPDAGTASAPGPVTTSVQTTATFGGAATLGFSVQGLPAGATAGFTPSTVTAGASTTLAVDPGTAASGDYPITVVATDAGDSNDTAQATFTLTVGRAFGMTLSRGAGAVGVTSAATTSVTTTVTLGSPATLDLSVSGAPSGLSVSGLTGALTAGGSRTLTFAAGTVPAGTYPFTITATDHDTPANTVSVPYTITVDRSAPTASLTAPTQLVLLAKQVRLAWKSADQGVGVASVALRYRAASSTAGFGSWRVPSGWSALHVTSVTAIGLREGGTYCYSVRATDKAGNVGAWSAQRCVTVPLDDRSLAASSGWLRRTGSGYFDGTVTRVVTSARSGRTLARTTVRLTRVGIVATRCWSCGSVRITVAGRLIGTVSLRGPSATRWVFLLPRVSVRTGRLVLTTTTSGKPVAVDAVVVAQA